MKERCQRYQRSTQSSIRAFSFFGPKNFFEITISGVRTGERKVSAEPMRSLNSLRAFSSFGPNIFSSNSHIGEWEVTAVPTWCPEQYASILVFGSNKFYFDITISDARTG